MNSIFKNILKRILTTMKKMNLYYEENKKTKKIMDIKTVKLYISQLRYNIHLLAKLIKLYNMHIFYNKFDRLKNNENTFNKLIRGGEYLKTFVTKVITDFRFLNSMNYDNQSKTNNQEFINGISNAILSIENYIIQYINRCKYHNLIDKTIDNNVLNNKMINKNLISEYNDEINIDSEISKMTLKLKNINQEYNNSLITELTKQSPRSPSSDILLNQINNLSISQRTNLPSYMSSRKVGGKKPIKKPIKKVKK